MYYFDCDVHNQLSSLFCETLIHNTLDYIHLKLKNYHLLNIFKYKYIFLAKHNV